jgi:RNA-directed DNA polymerase
VAFSLAAVKLVIEPVLEADLSPYTFGYRPGKSALDAIVILGRGRAAEALDWTRNAITRLGLTLNEAKTKLKNARRERFEFLGYSFGRTGIGAMANCIWGVSPSPKSVARLKQNVRDHLKKSHRRPWPDVRDGLNAILRGWDGYFC